MKKKLYHYTSIVRLESIMIEGIINLATSKIDKKEKPAVWLSTNSDWERTATKGKSKQWMEVKFGLARIEVKHSDRILTYAKFKHKSGISQAVADGLESVAIKQGANPNEWYISFRPITEEDFVGIEIYNYNLGRWESITQAAIRAAHLANSINK